jgi:pyridoxamine 5'-phosphate oxidase
MAGIRKVKLDTPMSETGDQVPTQITRDGIRAMRRSYGDVGLLEGEINRDPIEQFKSWLEAASENIMIVEANAMVLSAILNDETTSRTVLLKDVHDSGFTFFTNYQSEKAQAIAQNQKVSLLFPWYAMERQVIIRGTAAKVSAQESDEYFATRPWGSKIGAWASSQSQVLESREVLEARYQEFAAKYPEGSEVPRPEHWGGYLVKPSLIEFWQGRYSRLHDRLRYTLHNNLWQVTRLNP